MDNEESRGVTLTWGKGSEKGYTPLGSISNIDSLPIQCRPISSNDFNYAGSSYYDWMYGPVCEDFTNQKWYKEWEKESKKIKDNEIELKYLKKENGIYKSMVHNRNNKIKGIYPNEKKRILVVKFNDDSIVKLACHKDDEFDINIGVALAYAYKCFGSKTHFKKVVKELTKEIK